MSGEEGVVEGEGLTAVDGLSAANGLLRENLAAVDAGLAGASLKRKFEESFRDQLATQHLPPQSRPKVISVLENLNMQYFIQCVDRRILFMEY